MLDMNQYDLVKVDGNGSGCLWRELPRLLEGLSLSVGQVGSALSHAST